MRRILLIDNHAGFHLAMARTVLAGGALLLVTSLWPVAGWLSGLLTVVLLGAAIAPPRTLRQAAWLLSWGVIGGGGAAIASHPGSTAVCGAVGLALCLGLSVAHGEMPPWQRLLTIAAGGLLFLGAGLLPAALSAQDFVHELPGEVGTLLAGMGMGLVVGSSAIVRQLRVQLDPVDRELLGLLPDPAHKDEISGLVAQALHTYKEAAEALEGHQQARTAAEDLVKKIARFGKRWQEIEAQAKKSDRAQLEARMQELQQRQEAATDEQVRSEYERAQGALSAQLSYLREIDNGRERAVARLHHQVATLERLRLAAIRHRSVDAAKMGEELRAVVDDLTRAGQDLDSAAEALAEVPA